MTAEEESGLHKSLLKGNVQSVTFLRDCEEVKGFIEANLKERTVNIYDAHMKPLSKEQKLEFMDFKPAGQKLEQKTATVKGGDDLEDNAQLKKKQARTRGYGISM
ncbi:hypothetical protein [Terrimonas ferruginea]|uniref:hypothetical protein n=1 Tax=Terrimonas ferruginea TaxID=249 RepID=UPI0003FF7B55|nr:hypothetical protein [Terrimonas ferruginea]